MKLVKAYKVTDVLDPDMNLEDKLVAIVYRDDYDRRCTMFVRSCTLPGTQVLIDLINGVGHGE